jgi:hypothetical protein
MTCRSCKSVTPLHELARSVILDHLEKSPAKTVAKTVASAAETLDGATPRAQRAQSL